MARNSIVVILFAFLSACSLKPKTELHPEFKTYFDEFEVEGCFLLYDFQKDKTTIYNPDRCEQGFLPASTFKMVNTLIGLDNGIITGEDFIIPWDSVHRQIPAWNREHNLPSAFKNSVVPWYQELARKTELEKMQKGLEKAQFGKMDVLDKNLDLFWLTGNSRITPLEQLDFQKRLVKNELQFKQEDINLLKKIMILKESSEFILRGKTGWAIMDATNIGWLVGYIETKNNTYAYVLNVESDADDTTLFSKSRTGITEKIIAHLGLM